MLRNEGEAGREPFEQRPLARRGERDDRGYAGETADLRDLVAQEAAGQRRRLAGP